MIKILPKQSLNDQLCDIDQVQQLNVLDTSESGFGKFPLCRRPSLKIDLAPKASRPFVRSELSTL